MQTPRIGMLSASEHRPSLLIWSGCLILVLLVIISSSWNLYRNLQDRRRTVAYSTQVLAGSVAGYAGSVMGPHLGNSMEAPLTAIEDYLDHLGYKPGITVALIDAQGRVVLQKGKLPSSELLVGEDGLQLLEGGAAHDVFLARRTVARSSLHAVIARWPDEYLASWYQQRQYIFVEMFLQCLVLLGTASGLVSACLRLSRKERRYRELVELLPEGLLVIRNDRVIFANQAATKLFGAKSLNRFIGLGIFQLVDVSCFQQLREDLEDVSRPDYLPVFLPRHYKRLDGANLQVEMAAQRLFMDGELCVQVVVRDVSEHLRMQHDLEVANTRLQRLSGQIIEVQEAERRHLARELHDDVGQLLTFIKISAAGIQRHLSGLVEQRQAALVRIADEALSKVRNLSRMLRPVQLESLGLVAAMRWQVENYLPDATDGVQCRLNCEELLPRPDLSVEITLFRIFQEALCNVLKHSSACQVEIELACADYAAYLTISDDGCGFDYAGALLNGQGMGLVSMAERAKLLGGEFTLSSSPGAGTQVSVRLPYS